MARISWLFGRKLQESETGVGIPLCRYHQERIVSTLMSGWMTRGAMKDIMNNTTSFRCYVEDERGADADGEEGELTGTRSFSANLFIQAR